MKFTRYPRAPFEDTHLKRFAAERRQRREREAFPLFAADIAAKQPSIDNVMQERAARWTRQDQAMRDFRASQWRDIRRRFYELPAQNRQIVRDAMTKYGGPPNAIAWAYLIRIHGGTNCWA